MEISEKILRNIVEESLARMHPDNQKACPIAPKCLDLSTAVGLSKACAEKALQMGVPVCISVVDSSGIPILFNRMSNALLVSVEIAPKKAYTSVVLGMSTEQAGAFTRDLAEGLDTSLEGKIVLFAGGFPIRIDGVLLGGLGISGGTPTQDKEIAECGLRAMGWL